MSHVALENTQSTCPVEVELRGPNVAIGSLSLIEAVFKIQADASYGELGDSMVEAKSDVVNAQERAGTRLPEITATTLFRAANACLTNRYLGNCAVAGNCSGKAFVDEKLVTWGISRYKSIIQEV